MAPDGQASAVATTSCAGTASGLIHAPGTLAWKTSGRPSTQLREWMHFSPSKRTTSFSPRYSCTFAPMPAPVVGLRLLQITAASAYFIRRPLSRLSNVTGPLGPPRNAQRRFQPTAGKVAQSHRTAMRLRDVTRDRQAEAAASGI